MTITPAGADAGALVNPPTYEFTAPADTVACPNTVSITPPADPHVDCKVISGPSPTSCTPTSTCVAMTFWGEQGDALRAALGTDDFNMSLTCDGRFLGISEWAKVPRDNAIFCRSPRTGAVQ